MKSKEAFVAASFAALATLGLSGCMGMKVEAQRYALTCPQDGVCLRTDTNTGEVVQYWQGTTKLVLHPGPYAAETEDARPSSTPGSSAPPH